MFRKYKFFVKFLMLNDREKEVFVVLLRNILADKEDLEFKFLEFVFLKELWKKNYGKHDLLKDLGRNGLDMNEERLRQVLKTLNHYLDKYLAFISLNRNEKEIALKGLREARRRQQYRVFELERNKIERNTSFQKIHHGFFEEKVMFMEENYLFQAEQKRPSDHFLQELDVCFDEQFLFKKLKYACDMLNRKKIFKVEYDISYLESILSITPKEKMQSNIGIWSYYQVYKLLLTEEEGFFESLKQLLSNESIAFQLSELKELYAHLQNYCILKINKGQERFRKELLALYDYQLKEKILIDGGQMSLFDYKNIATLSIQVNELEWLESFTKEYTMFIPEKFREMAFAYNMARIYFLKKNYREAIKLLHQNIYDDIYYNIGTRTLLIKIYFERDDLAFLETVVQSFKMYLERNKIISSVQKDAYLHFTVLTYKLCRDIDQKSKLQKHHEKFLSLPKVAEEKWLKQKFAEIL